MNCTKSKNKNNLGEKNHTLALVHLSLGRLLSIHIQLNMMQHVTNRCHITCYTSCLYADEQKNSTFDEWSCLYTDGQKDSVLDKWSWFIRSNMLHISSRFSLPTVPVRNRMHGFH